MGCARRLQPAASKLHWHPGRLYHPMAPSAGQLTRHPCPRPSSGRRARAPSRRPAMYEPAIAAGRGRPNLKNGGPERAAKGRRPRTRGGGPGPSGPFRGRPLRLEMGLPAYRDDLGVRARNPEPPRHATWSSMARSPSSPQQGTASSEGGAVLIRGRRRLGPGPRLRKIEGGPPSVQSHQLLAGSEAPVVRREFTSKLTVHA